ncbi:DUF2846 domain-containing protein, partial [Stutzerimonas tarimensis]
MFEDRRRDHRRDRCQYLFLPAHHPGAHTLSTESEFGDNLLQLNAEAGKNHYVRQSIKLGLFVGGAKLTEVSESEGQKAVRKRSINPVRQTEFVFRKSRQRPASSST